MSALQHTAGVLAAGLFVWLGLLAAIGGLASFAWWIVSGGGR